MSHHLPNPAALLTALVALAIGPQVQAACSAANPNANMIESTPTSAFTIHGNGTVTHALTGLMWKQCVQGLSGAGCANGSATTMTWSAALTASVTDHTAGYSDWRLPNKKELNSIVELCGWDPSINLNVFPATPAAYFWSSSSYSSYVPYAWEISFKYGVELGKIKSTAVNVRLVRGGQSFDSFDAASPILELIFDDGFE